MSSFSLRKCENVSSIVIFALQPHVGKERGKTQTEKKKGSRLSVEREERPKKGQLFGACVLGGVCRCVGCVDDSQGGGWGSNEGKGGF